MVTQQLAEGLTFEPLHEGKLLVYTFTGVHREAVDAWFDSVAGLLEAWPQGRPFLMAVDASASILVPTPYARKRTNELSQLHPEVTGRTALIIENKLTGQVFRFLLGQLQRASKAKRERQAFISKPDAIAWLEELLSV